MKKDKFELYAERRAKALREFRRLRRQLISKDCTVEIINRAFELKRNFNL